jgi:hypothetical protein
MAQAPVSKLFNAINPIAKSSIELVSGKQYFPDMFNPRIMRDWKEYLASTLGVTPEFRALTGRPSPGYLKERFGGLWSYTLNPDEAAYWWIQGKKRQFQENVLGTAWSGAGSVSERSMALWRIKQAIRYGDRQALIKYAREYIAFGGTDKGFETSLNSMKPLAGLNKADEAQFLKWLTPEDRQYLRKALGYYQELIQTLK